MNRILNEETLISHGNRKLRRDALEIIDTGMSSSDPYYNVSRLISLNGRTLRIGNPEFEAKNDPQSGYDEYDIDSFEHIYVIGAGKGIQIAAKAIEDILGDYLTGGEVICKHGDPLILKKIDVTCGNHPTPDMGCVEGCLKILDIARRVTENDLVFTLVGNGVSSLLTLPDDGVELEDVIEITRLMQIEMGIVTMELNQVRNHIDKLKGGKLARAFKKARQVCIALVDIGHMSNSLAGQNDYNALVKCNEWLHNMPDGTTFEQARVIMDRYNVWRKCPSSVAKMIREADQKRETVKYSEFKNYRFRLFGVMPESDGFYTAAVKKAESLGYNTFLLTDELFVEAKSIGRLMGDIAICASRGGYGKLPLPLALLLSGESLVTVGDGKGVGGRNQEDALSFSQRVDGNTSVVMAGVDTDGTDGPGGLKIEGAPNCLAGGIVDGYTAGDIRDKGYDINTVLRQHATSEPLWHTGNGIHARQGISVNDLIVVLVDTNT